MESSDLDNCKLCRSPAQKYWGTTTYSCSNGECPMNKVRLMHNQWNMLNHEPKQQKIKIEQGGYREPLNAVDVHE